MPSKLPLFAVRLSPDEHDKINRIRAAAGAAIGLAVSQADFVRLALPLMEAKYPPAEEVDAAPPKKGRRGKGGG